MVTDARRAADITPISPKGSRKLRQIGCGCNRRCMNLMRNGIEAIRDTSGELSINARLAEDGQLLISVADTGMGLSANKVDKIVDSLFPTKDQGTGLGLAITRSTIASHGGRIRATTNSGRGATFHFTLPIAVAAAA
jgi:signal transduction histidine kinase